MGGAAAAGSGAVVGNSVGVLAVDGMVEGAAGLAEDPAGGAADRSWQDATVIAMQRRT